LQLRSAPLLTTSEPVLAPVWGALTHNSSDLPDDDVRALAPDVNGALWIGTLGGLARLDEDGRWQIYSETSTNGGLPDDNVQVLTPGADFVLWVGTGRGLTRLDKHGHWDKVQHQRGLAG
jgi:ligand-binding sensor domain-containing protein